MAFECIPLMLQLQSFLYHVLLNIKRIVMAFYNQNLGSIISWQQRRYLLYDLVEGRKHLTFTCLFMVSIYPKILENSATHSLSVIDCERLLGNKNVPVCPISIILFWYHGRKNLFGQIQWLQLQVVRYWIQHGSLVLLDDWKMWHLLENDSEYRQKPNFLVK